MKVVAYFGGEVLSGSASPALVAACGARDDRASMAFRDDAGVWQPVPTAREREFQADPGVQTVMVRP